jgi:Arc/MetJ family transcription regulator
MDLFLMHAVWMIARITERETVHKAMRRELRGMGDNFGNFRLGCL